MDPYQANLYYGSGQKRFFEGDYKLAAQFFSKALKNDRNHYLAYWYHSLCQVYTGEGDKLLYTAGAMAKAATAALVKLDKSFATEADKKSFVDFVFGQSFAYLRGNFERAVSEAEQSKSYFELRRFSLEFARAAAALTAAAKASPVVNIEDGLVKVLSGICDVGTAACYRVARPFAHEGKVAAPASDAYAQAVRLYGELRDFAKEIGAPIGFWYHLSDFSAALEGSNKVFDKIRKYDYDNRANSKTRFSIVGEGLDSLLDECGTAAEFIYHTLRSGLSGVIDDTRVKLASVGLRFCMETLKPRITPDDKRYHILLRPSAELSCAIKYFNAFAGEIAAVNPKVADDYYKLIFSDTNAALSKYFDRIFTKYNRYADKLKDRPDSQGFLYYYNFLYNAARCCAYALDREKGGLGDGAGQAAERRKLIKTGKKASGEFMFLFDHNIAKIGRSERFGDIIDIFYKFTEY